jgi:Tfp pilus assembly protein PilX
MTNLYQRHALSRNQRGISLVIVMVLVMAMALMTITAMYMSQVQYKLVGNVQQSEIAFNEAEVALVTAEAWLSTADNSKKDSFESYSEATPYLYPVGKLSALGHAPASMTWGDSNSMAANKARYLIEQLAGSVAMPGSSIAVSGQANTACKSARLFRVIAKAETRAGGSRIVETIQAVPAC